MPKGHLEVALEPVAGPSGDASPGPGGAETVELRVTLNTGFAPRPLRKVASGGELSRVMLALKTVLAGVDRVPTLVFDEIDAGIAVRSPRPCLRSCTRWRAAIKCLWSRTSPQLASRADGHLVVEKKTGAGSPPRTCERSRGRNVSARSRACSEVIPNQSARGTTRGNCSA